MDEEYQKRLDLILKNGEARAYIQGNEIAKDNGKNVLNVVKSILENSKNWKKSGFVSYAANIQFSAEGLTLNILPDALILNIQDSKGKWLSIFSHISKAEYNKILAEVDQLQR